MHYSRTNYFRLYLFSCISMLLCCIPNITAHEFSHTIQRNNHNPDVWDMVIAYTIEPQHYIYHDSLRFSVDTPALTLQEWRSDKSPQKQYDAQHKTNKNVYSGSGSFIITLKKEPDAALTQPAHVHVQFLTDGHPPVQMHRFMINPEDIAHIEQTVQTDKKLTTAAPEEAPQETSSSVTQKIAEKLSFIKNYTSDLVKTTQSPWIRIVLVFLLGLLMSLTPCIYPMIPITVGILQSGGKKTLLSNFLQALSYTLGIATTFAVMGLLAASGSAQFGALMGNTYFVLFLILFLGYFGLSMFGFYEIYIPSFLQPKQQSKVNGSFISAFILGVISGTFASPCLSPGLLLLLSIVVTIGNKLLGFILLFAFGFGIGIPLLVIGTFSGALTYLPRAGTWMLEIKKIFGILLIGMCFFYLNNIMPTYIVITLFALFLFIMGIVYTTSIAPYESSGMRRYKYVMAIVCVIVACITALYAYKLFSDSKKPQQSAIAWETDYMQARKKAQKENKKMLLDFTASWCTACKEIEHTIFTDAQVIETLKNVVPVKVDCTNPSETSCAHLQKQFNVLGCPTILLIDPETEKALGQWGAELLDNGQQALVTAI